MSASKHITIWWNAPTWQQPAPRLLLGRVPRRGFPMTASAAEVEAAQKALGCRQGPTVYDDSTPEYALCLSDVHVHALFMGECEFARLVADAVVAAAQPGIAAETLREAARDLPGFDGIRTHGDAARWLRDRADRIEAPRG